jgi:hypothetical protein
MVAAWRRGTILHRRMNSMKDIVDLNRGVEGFSETRESIYPKYITGDAKIEGFCTFNELKARIEQLEALVGQLCDQAKNT